jgi:putative acetyltransferase
MILRPFQPSDLEQFIDVYRTAIHTLAAPFYAPDELSAWAPPYMDPDHWRKRIATVRAIVGEEDGIVAGFLTYDLTGHIDMLFIRPAFARRGLATRLYASAEAELRKALVSRVFAEVSLAARPFFERVGFRVDAEELAECRGQKLRRFRMSRMIGAS